MTEFNAFLMPTDFMRRWSPDELIPALLYFDRVTFLMDDIDTPDRLIDPKLLEGRPDEDFEGGLQVAQHRYFWPMRDLMNEEVIVISWRDTGGEMGSPRLMKIKQDFEALLKDEDKLALEYLDSSARYYDLITGYTDVSGNAIGKAFAVRGWIQNALSFRRHQHGWKNVTLHPDGQRSLVAAITLFDDLRRLVCAGDTNREAKWYDSPNEMQDGHYVAMRVMAEVLRNELHSFTVGKDPQALSEILEVRHKRRDEFEAFRQAMLEAEQQFSGLTSSELVKATENYVAKVTIEFENMKNLMSDRWRTPKLVLRKTGTLLAVGISVFVGSSLGAMAGGPVGAVIGGTTTGTAAAKMIEEMIKETGKQVAGPMGKDGTPIQPSLTYLFHAQKALQ